MKHLTAGQRLLLADCDRIAALPEEKFDMRAPGNLWDAEAGECGSPACFGGWVRAWSGVRDYIGQVGERRYGLSCEKLFFPDADVVKLKDGRSAYHATPAEAAQAGRNLALHGDPLWHTI
jgi:hypothetical protein